MRRYHYYTNESNDKPPEYLVDMMEANDISSTTVTKEDGSRLTIRRGTPTSAVERRFRMQELFGDPWLSTHALTAAKIAHRIYLEHKSHPEDVVNHLDGLILCLVYEMAEYDETGDPTAYLDSLLENVRGMEEMRNNNP